MTCPKNPANFRKKADSDLLLVLACGATVEQAAAKCRLSERTVYRRLDDPEFQDRLRSLKAEMLQRAAGMLTAAAMESVKTLVELQKPNVAAAVRLGAARAVLEIGIKIREIVDLEVRLAALEERVGDGRGGRAA